MTTHNQKQLETRTQIEGLLIEVRTQAFRERDGMRPFGGVITTTPQNVRKQADEIEALLATERQELLNAVLAAGPKDQEYQVPPNAGDEGQEEAVATINTFVDQINLANKRWRKAIQSLQEKEKNNG